MHACLCLLMGHPLAVPTRLHLGEDDVSLYELSRWPHMALWARSTDMPPPAPMENTRTTWQVGEVLGIAY